MYVFCIYSASQPFSQDVEFSMSSEKQGVEVLSSVKKLDFDALVMNFEQGSSILCHLYCKLSCSYEVY